MPFVTTDEFSVRVTDSVYYGYIIKKDVNQITLNRTSL